MANEINLNNMINMQVSAKANNHARKESVQPVDNSGTDGLKVSSHINSLVNTLLAEYDVPDNRQRIAELKAQVDANQYHVDLDLLASKMAHELTNNK